MFLSAFNTQYTDKTRRGNGGLGTNGVYSLFCPFCILICVFTYAFYVYWATREDRA
ncbi:hypothetical protein AtNW77_Chr5g0140151 [Arabidopsis thaliana]